MMLNILDIGKMLMAILPFFFLCLAGRKVNLEKISRSRQFPMPIVALCYCIVTFLFIDKINSGLMWAINSLPTWLSFVSPWLGTLVGELLNKINWAYWIFYVSNPAIIVAYYAFKKVVITFLLKTNFGKNKKLYESIAGLFYEYDQDKNIWTVQEKYGQMRTYFKAFFYSAVVLSTLMFLICKKFIEDNLIVTPFFPVFGILIVAELYFFLDGLTRKEYLNNILGEDEDATMIVNYSLMRKFLRKMFGDRLETENTVTNSLIENTITNDELIEELLLNEDGKIEAFGKYIKALSATGFQLDHNYIHSTIDMLNGKSVLFNNPFYKDLIPYAFYPMNRTLLRHKKTMIVLGRHSIEKDISEWVADGITAVTNVPTMWRIGELTGEHQDLDIGIVNRSNVHNTKLHEANREFFSKVEYVVIIEPSKLVSTAQVGLNSLIKYCMNDRRNIVFCSCDKNCDGLVDSLSHILMTSLSEVSATNKNPGSTSYMCWDYDNTYWQHRMLPNVSRYLGIGTELSVAALKNQIQKAKWYGGESYPVIDQSWINRQYFYELLKYSGLVPMQEELMNRLHFTANLWSANIEKNSYMTVEDESNNMFEVVRTFATRATDQGFINVISGEYLLKEYMADNAFMFAADPKAIPYIVADYARTDRNVTSRLLLMLSASALTAEEIGKELSLMGIKTNDVKATLWREILVCYSSVAREFNNTNILKEELLIEDPTTGETAIFDSTIISERIRYNVNLGEYENVYTIKEPKFVSLVITELQSAGYIAEDEKGETYYLGAELRGHVFQRHLPGQFFTFDGKYYEVCSLSGDNQVIVRRAADHIAGRPLYRQIRTYTINKSKKSSAIGSQKVISGMLLSSEYADIQVNTPAYLDMPTAKDYVNAKTVTINNVPVRDYKNKKILRVELPNVTDDVRYTITYLLNEVFMTIFAENQAFISAVTKSPDDVNAEDDETQDAIKPLTYSLMDNSENNESNSIYIIEDSRLDLGLLITVERNFKRILEIVYDFLDWHLQAIEDSKKVSSEPESIKILPLPEEDEPKKKKISCGVVKRLFEKIKSLFKKLFKGKKEEPIAPGKAEDDPVNATDDADISDSITLDIEDDAEQDADIDSEESAETEATKSIFDDIADKQTESSSADDFSGYESDIMGDMEEATQANDEDDSSYEPKDVEIAPAEHEKSYKEDGLISDKAEPNLDKTDTNTESDEIDLISDAAETTDDSESESEDTGYLYCSMDNSDDFVVADNIKAADYEEESDNITNDTDSNEASDIDSENPFDNLLPDDVAEKDITGDEIVEEIPEPEQNEEETSDFADTEFPEDASESDKLSPEEESVDGEELPVDSDDSTDAGTNIDFITEDDESKKVSPVSMIAREKYHLRHFLLFGGTDESTVIAPAETRDYLAGLGADKNALKQARDGKDIAKMIEETYDPTKPDAHFCDFCGIELVGTEYEVLADGRERCMNCGKTAVKTGEEFTKIFKDVLRNMEAFFGIKINAGIRVEMVNSKKLHRRLKKSFISTNKSDPRVLGVAIKDNAGYSILIENGSPRMSSIMTIVHELTHIWQYLNWNDKHINSKYGKALALEVYEGMAKWVEIQYAILINEVAVAKRQEIENVMRRDEYGRGFIKYLNKYPLSNGSYITKPTPFLDKENPL